jgi:hypothetical protein
MQYNTRWAVVDLRSEKEIADFADRNTAQIHADAMRKEHNKPFAVYPFNADAAQ